MKFIDSSTYPKQGTSFVEIEHKGKTYIGEAHCHPDDKFSEYTGCRYAHERAEIEALKEEWRQKKHDCEECRKFMKAITSYKNFDKESPTAKCMFRQLNCRIREVNKLALIITDRIIKLNTAIREQGAVNKYIKQKRLNESNEK